MKKNPIISENINTWLLLSFNLVINLMGKKNPTASNFKWEGISEILQDFSLSDDFGNEKINDPWIISSPDEKVIAQEIEKPHMFDSDYFTAETIGSAIALGCTIFMIFKDRKNNQPDDITIKATYGRDEPAVTRFEIG